MTFDANAIFEEELSRRGATFVKEGEDEYRLRVDGGEVLANLANVRRNAERDQDADVIGGSQVDGHLGMVPLDSPYKASVMFAPAFKRFVEKALGWPVLVVAPCRDFIYVVADDSPLLGRIGSVVVEEFRNSGYPLTTDVLRLSDGGIEAIGEFPA